MKTEREKFDFIKRKLEAMGYRIPSQITTPEGLENYVRALILMKKRIIRKHMEKIKEQTEKIEQLKQILKEVEEDD